MKAGLATYKKRFARRLAAWSAVVASLAIALALVSGWTIGLEAAQDWKGEIASRYDLESFDRWEQQPAFASHINWLGRELDVEALLPDLSYETAAVRNHDGQMLLHYLFRAQDQKAVSLFIVQTDKANLSEPVVELRNGFPSATWTKSGVEYLLIGDGDFETVWAAARTLSAQ